MMGREQCNTSKNVAEDFTKKEFKIHISRVPTSFTEESVERILRETLFQVKDTSNNDESEGKESMIVELIYPKEEEEGEKHDKEKEKETNTEDHRGFGFVTFDSRDIYEKAIQIQSIKGGRKSTSTKLRTMYLRPYATQEEDAKRNICFLWTKNRCPYGDKCKFEHRGDGGCLEVPSGDGKNPKKKGKCFAFKKGKCNKGNDCPFSHDFEPVVDAEKSEKGEHRLVSEKHCINWKTKGKCKKISTCPYKHDPEVLERYLAKKKRKAGQHDNSTTENGVTEQHKKQKQQQPLCIRVFGMAYETTEQDIRTYFEDCGKINSIQFPTYEDSGRSKGYCGVWFASPKAVAKAVQLDGQELHGRWLSIQVGTMLLEEWEKK